MTTKTLHYTLTPVQAFVSQARRTRDLWAGSYLLSYLIGKAMVDNGKEHIIFPHIENDFLIKTITHSANNDEQQLASRLGSIPNRFTTKLDQQSGVNYRQSINNTWIKIAEEVKKHLENKGLEFDNRLTRLWKKQIEPFWEHQWVIGEESYLLDQRKNLRNHFKEDENHEKCTMCGEREELSPHEKAIPKRINSWWQTEIRNRIHKLDLGKSERLCAVCLTKRLFPTISKAAIGIETPRFYPSTAYLSAIDWLIEIITKSKENENLKQAMTEFTNLAQKVLYKKHEVAERSTLIKAIEELIQDDESYRDFVNLDGDVFYLSSIQNSNYELKDESKRSKLISALSNLYRIVGSKPSPFYAILFMDGDGMGALLGGKSANNKQQISETLSDFTRKVPEIVYDHNGILTYAGGDDVFALLPVSKAMECAKTCRDAYREAFKKIENIVPAHQSTISAAIEYTHMNTALGTIVRDSHSLLDDIAKEQTGRNALACRVWKRGGPILTWAQPWKLTPEDKLITDHFEYAFNSFHGNQPENLSSKLLYKLRDLLDMVQGNTMIFSHGDIKELLISEYLSNREYDKTRFKNLSITDKRQEAEKIIDPLLLLCQQHQRNHQTGEVNSQHYYTADVALLIRFLSQKEV